jgi:hypothetical protein
LLSFSTVANTDDYYYDLDEVNKNLDTDIIEFFVTIFLKILLKDVVQTPVQTLPIESPDLELPSAIPQDKDQKSDETIESPSLDDNKSNKILGIEDYGSDFKLLLKVLKNLIFDREYLFII